MDGNGRWAETRHLPRILGHRRGVETVRKIVTAVRKEQIPFLTLYAFSSENWQRPDEEVGALMGLLGHYLSSELKTMRQQEIRLQVIGDTTRLPANVREILQDAVQATAGNRTMTLVLALSYGGRAKRRANLRPGLWRERSLRLKSTKPNLLIVLKPAVSPIPIC